MTTLSKSRVKPDPITKAADDLISSPELINTIKAYADTSTKAKLKQDAAQKALERSTKYQRWLDRLPDEEQRTVIRVGLIAYLSGEE